MELMSNEKQEKENNSRKIVIICLIAITVMFSRIYLGVHYFSDIIGGITSGLLFLFISYYYYTFKFKVPYYPGKRK